MFWYHGGMTGWGWVLMSLSTLLFWAVLVAAGLLLFRALSRVPRDTHPVGRSTPEQVLAERFARGEIDEDEYRRRLAVLRGESQGR
jgi:putative membrane protein